MSIVDSLCNLPAGDCNYESALKDATEGQLTLAIKIMEMNTDGKNKSRIQACRSQLNKIKNV